MSHEDPLCPCATDPTAACVGPWLHERSWDESGADVPWWTVPLAMIMLAVLLVLVVVIVVVV